MENQSPVTKEYLGQRFDSVIETLVKILARQDEKVDLLRSEMHSYFGYCERQFQGIHQRFDTITDILSRDHEITAQKYVTKTEFVTFAEFNKLKIPY